jgi:hypothetical protein
MKKYIDWKWLKKTEDISMYTEGQRDKRVNLKTWRNTENEND